MVLLWLALIVSRKPRCQWTFINTRKLSYYLLLQKPNILHASTCWWVSANGQTECNVQGDVVMFIVVVVYVRKSCICEEPQNEWGIIFTFLLLTSTFLPPTTYPLESSPKVDYDDYLATTKLVRKASRRLGRHVTRFTLAVVVSRLATHQFYVVESSLGCIDYRQEWLPPSKKFRQSFRVKVLLPFFPLFLTITCLRIPKVSK